MKASEIEKSIMVAEFMEAIDAGSPWPKKMTWRIPHVGTWSVHQFKYHKSWDWLMPVVEKIESLYDEHHGYFGVHISSNSCSIQGTNLHLSINNPEYGSVYTSDPNAVFETKIESTYYAVTQFIKWYKTLITEKAGSKP